ncbi:hypothetical protein A3K79_06750 [Candidatus Bathyarchaeota archaeon RBG_13_46_16b]|nr:MAG: hypothetical protein A3K79_06750 [Candidatus Bathyarchaeota archaeon RBG_13_46_16b]
MTCSLADPLPFLFANQLTVQKVPTTTATLTASHELTCGEPETGEHCLNETMKRTSISFIYERV